jgi:N-acetylmuramic acid 6-phosphate etherase
VKLIDRGVRMIMEEIPVTYEEAEKLLKEHGSVRKAVESYKL